MTMTMKIQREVEAKEIAYLVFGTGALGYPWWGGVEWGHEEDGEDFPIEQGGDLDIAEEDDYIILKHDARDDAEGDMTGKTRLTFAAITAAAAQAIRKGYVAERDAIYEDLGLCDAAEADAVLQMAVFGELVYG